MDPVAEGGTATLAGPVAAPVRQEVAVGAVPERLADGHLRPRARRRCSSCVGPPGARAVAVLEDAVDRAGARLVGGDQGVQIHQVGGGRLLQQHRPAALQELERRPHVAARRGGDRDQVGLLIGQLGDGAVRRRAVVAGVGLARSGITSTTPTSSTRGLAT